MPVAFPEIRVGQPVRHEALTVFPLFTSQASGLEYLVSDEALAGGSVAVEEVSEAGSVPALTVDNRGDTLVLLIEGEELRGARQNRVLNTSVLAAARKKTTIPVSCVERGRWGYKTRNFEASETRSSTSILYAIKSSVAKSLKEEQGHQSDQRQVWAEIDRVQKALGTASPTSALGDTYDSCRQRISEFQEKLPYVDGATGLAVAIGEKIVTLDLFDKPATCRKVWNRLLSGLVLDALEAQPSDTQVEASQVERVIATVSNLPWERADQVGEGEEYRATADGLLLSALIYQGVPVHASAVAERDWLIGEG
ncbi:MAG: DUF6569 family protein [Thermoguttaceae bacterium]|jgi:hypothetical protein